MESTQEIKSVTRDFLDEIQNLKDHEDTAVNTGL